MPLRSMHLTSKSGHLIQVCAACGAQHKISLDRAAVKSKTGPFSLSVGYTLMIAVDSGDSQTAKLGTGDVPSLESVTAAELAAVLGRALRGVIASDDAGGVLLESASTGPESRVEVLGGSARAALGFPVDAPPDPCPGRPVLGFAAGSQTRDPNTIALRRCHDCGSHEYVLRTFDAAPPELAGTHFYEHRRAVNALAEHCKARGWSHPEFATEHAIETACPVDIHPALTAGEHSIELPAFVPAARARRAATQGGTR